MDFENTSSYKNGLFGLPTTLEQAQLVLLPVPWEVTASYGSGSALGPEAILKESPQLDLYDYDFKDFIKKGVYWDKEFLSRSKISEDNKKFKERAYTIQKYLESSNQLSAELKNSQQEINELSAHINQTVYMAALNHLSNNKTVGLVGGDHSSPLGLMRAVLETHPDTGILHIDAHADLRVSYQGFKYSHASIMTNLLDLKPDLATLTQVGVRDFCQSEFNTIQSRDNIHCFFDAENKANMALGANWDEICSSILETLPQKVYISFDIDGLSPELCPNTGTPVPGGLSFHEISYLFKRLKQANRQVVGFDLCEVAPADNSSWDGNVGARILFKLCSVSLYQQ
ncbi:MAG: agmatinase family protein [Bdellovibrionaceae bacterium]|jgi:agmatinase|nr:agmatinase family protein [Pseudobdellovibrionaceae bacterium]